MKMIQIHSSQAIATRHPEFGKFQIPLGRSTLPEPLAKSETLARYIREGIITLNSKFGDQPREAEAAKVGKHEARRDAEIARQLPGPDIAIARPINGPDGKPDGKGRWEVIREKTKTRVKAFDTADEATAFAEQLSAQAWTQWMAAKAGAA